MTVVHSSIFGLERATVIPAAPAAPQVPATPAQIQKQPQTPSDRRALGRAARTRVPRESHSAWSAPAERADPLALLEEQAKTRLPELIPVRYGRMLTSPFAFYRGASAIMAADLAATPRSGFQVQLCGDAHLSNFGGFALPNGGTVFDIHDFDETLPGPWEWDVKRLATSIYIAGRMRGCDDDECQVLVLGALASYRGAMREFAELPLPAVLNTRLDSLKRQGRELRHTESRASGKHGTNDHTRNTLPPSEKLTHHVNGKLRIAAYPPFAVPIEGLSAEHEQQIVEEVIRRAVQTFERSNARTFEHYEYAHMARKVVGIGSLGLHSWIVLLLGKDYQEPLFLQVKEAQASVLEPYTGRRPHTGQGQRVVEGQRLLQAQNDSFLGWGHVNSAQPFLANSLLSPGNSPRDYYVRQLWDCKISANVEHMPMRELLIYGEMCGWTLARAHACTGDRIAIAHYLGKGPAFDRAIAEFSRLYAHQNERDYQSLRKAVERGVVKVQKGV